MENQIKRRVFFSFHYGADVWRASQIRNMGVVDNSSTFSDNDWEEVKKKSDIAIKRWINSQMAERSCLVVLIGAETYLRYWVYYEIQKAYELGKGIVGIYVHNLKDEYGNQSEEGFNPFDFIETEDGEPLSSYVVAYRSRYTRSNNVYRDIADSLPNLIEEAIENASFY